MWSPEEHQLFSNFEGRINMLELEVLVLVVVANLRQLKDKYLYVQIDNTSAPSWANAGQVSSSPALGPSITPYLRVI